MWRHAVLQHGCFYSNGIQYSFMQALFYIIVRNGFSMNFSIRGSSARWSRTLMVRVTALDIQVSLRNPTAILEDSVMSVKTLYGKTPDHHVTMKDISTGESALAILWQHFDSYEYNSTGSDAKIEAFLMGIFLCLFCKEFVLFVYWSQWVIIDEDCFARWFPWTFVIASLFIFHFFGYTLNIHYTIFFIVEKS